MLKTALHSGLRDSVQLSFNGFLKNKSLWLQDPPTAGDAVLVNNMKITALWDDALASINESNCRNERAVALEAVLILGGSNGKSSNGRGADGGSSNHHKGGADNCR